MRTLVSLISGNDRKIVVFSLKAMQLLMLTAKWAREATNTQTGAAGLAKWRCATVARIAPAACWRNCQ